MSIIHKILNDEELDDNDVKVIKHVNDNFTELNSEVDKIKNMLDDVSSLMTSGGSVDDIREYLKQHQ
jgi:hypothetical protein